MSGAFLASSAIRCSLVETSSGLDVPCIFPSSGSVARLPSPSTGSLGSVPLLLRYGGELRLPAALLVALRCLRAALTIASLVLFAPPPCRARRSGAWAVRCLGCPPVCYDGDDRISQVPGEPLCVYAVLFDPGRASV